MRIKVKIKHIILSLLMIGMCIILIIVFTPEMRLFAAKIQYEQGELEWKQAVVEAIESTVFENRKWQLIREHMIELGPMSGTMYYDVYIGPGFTQSREDIRTNQGFGWSVKLPYLQDYLENAPVDGYLIRTAKQIAYYYNSEGQLDLALQALELGEKRLIGSQHQSQHKELMMERVQLYTDYNELGHAEQLLQHLEEQIYTSKSYLNTRLSQLRIQILLRQGNLQQALDLITEEIEEYGNPVIRIDEENPHKAPAKSDRIDLLVSIKDNLILALQDENNLSVVSGIAKRSDGTVLPNVGIFLREKEVVHHSVIQGERYQTRTDQEGHFKFDNVTIGSYQLFIGLKFEQIDGFTWPVQYDRWIDIEGSEQLVKDIVLQPLLELDFPVNEQIITDQTVHFKWESVDGAAYYNLNLGIELPNGFTTSLLRSNIIGNELYVDVSEIYDTKVGFAIVPGEGDDWVSVEPATLLAFTNTEHRIVWSVGAVDADGNLLTSSAGYRLNMHTIGNLPFFYLKERVMTEADMLLLDYQHDAALAAYKAAYEADANDKHSLWMVDRLLEAEEFLNKYNGYRQNY